MQATFYQPFLDKSVPNQSQKNHLILIKFPVVFDTNSSFQEKAEYMKNNPEKDPFRELTEEEEDFERRQKQAMDEHRDHVRRGDGNRKNMG